MVWFGHLTLPTIYFSRRSFWASHVSAVSAKPPNLSAYTAISGLKKELWEERAPFYTVYFTQLCCNNGWYSSRDKVPCTIWKKCVAFVCLLLKIFGLILTLRIWLKGTVFTNEKRGGLKVASFDWSRFKLFTLKFWNKLVQTPFIERLKTTQRRGEMLKVRPIK